MPFRLKKVDATYQSMMNKVFKGQIKNMWEVYMDNMIVKSWKEVGHLPHLHEVFKEVSKNNMKLNLENAHLDVRVGKFLGFYLTERGNADAILKEENSSP